MTDQLTLVGELWCPDAPDLAAPALLAALRAVSADAEVTDGSLAVPHPATEGLPPLVTAVVVGSPRGTDGKALPDVSQTWSWPEAEAAVASCRASVLVTELSPSTSSGDGPGAGDGPGSGDGPGAGDGPGSGSGPGSGNGYSPAERVAALGRVVEVLVALTGPAAIHWARSQRVSDPAAFGPEDVDGVLNVRMYADAHDDQALAMDTLGLHVFDLPDVQCHFRDRAPGEIAELLFATAVYLFEAGDVIDDGNTISGTDGEGRYVCHREASLLDPARLVLDVDLGDPYAAGRRERGPNGG